MKKISIISLVLITFFVSLASSDSDQKQKKLYILSIGVNAFAYSEEEDYVKETRYLIDEITKSSIHTFHTITNHRVLGKDATVENCLKAMDEIQDSDFVIVYIGAHGGWTENGGYLFCAKDGLIYDEAIISRLSKIKGNLFVILDTCHSGGFIREWNNTCKNRFIPDNVFILSACDEHNSAYDWTLTTGFVRALYGSDFNGDGWISCEEIAKYSRTALEYSNYRQIPTFIGNDIIFFRR